MKKISWKGFRLPTAGQQQRQRSGSISAGSSTLSGPNNSNGASVGVSHSQSSSQLPITSDSRDGSSTDLYLLPTSGSCFEFQQVEESRFKKKKFPWTSKKLSSPSSSVTCSVSHHRSNHTAATLIPATANSISSSNSSCSSTSSSTPATTTVVSTPVTRRSPDTSHHSSSSTNSTNTSSSVSSRHSASSCCPPHGNGASSPNSTLPHYQIGLLSPRHHTYNEEDSLVTEQVLVQPTKQRKDKKNLLRNLRHCFTPAHNRKVGANHNNKTLGSHNNSTSSGLNSVPSMSRKVTENIDECQSVPGFKGEGRKAGHRSLTNIRDSGRNSNADCCNIQNATLKKLSEMHLHPAADSTLHDGHKTESYQGKDISMFQKKLLEDYIGNSSGVGGDNGGSPSPSQSGSSLQGSFLSGPGCSDNNNVENNRLPRNCEQLSLILNEHSPTVVYDQWPSNTNVLYKSCSNPTGSCGNLMPHYDPGRLESPKVWSLTEELFRLSKFGWYWGPITRVEAEEKLLNKPDGAFLVRDSSDERYLLSLSFRSYGKTLHTRIEHCNGMFSFYAQPDTEGYPSIVDLIEHSMSDSVQTGIFCYYRSRSPGAPSFPVRLTKPVSRFTQVRTLQYLCRFVIRQYIRFDHIQQLPLPNSIKGWIEENQY